MIFCILWHLQLLRDMKTHLSRRKLLSQDHQMSAHFIINISNNKFQYLISHPVLREEDPKQAFENLRSGSSSNTKGTKISSVASGGVSSSLTVAKRKFHAIHI